MSKGKLEKFAALETFKNVFQCPFSVISQGAFDMKGKWREQYFHNDNPIVLELGCGKGEYTVGLACKYPEINFIGVDIKGARIYTGAKQALEQELDNVAFLRTSIEFVDRFFAKDEVQEIWLTFSDPQMKNVHKRLTSTFFMNRYKQFLVDGGIVHLKTDSNFLFTYTTYMVSSNNLPVLYRTEDLYGNEHNEKAEAEEKIDDKTLEILSIHTYYEKQWIERGLNIKYMKFTLPHNVSLIEPNIEIELDEYRSYKRFKRSGLEKSK